MWSGLLAVSRAFAGLPIRKCHKSFKLRQTWPKIIVSYFMTWYAPVNPPVAPLFLLQNIFFVIYRWINAFIQSHTYPPRYPVNNNKYRNDLMAHRIYTKRTSNDKRDTSVYKMRKLYDTSLMTYAYPPRPSTGALGIAIRSSKWAHILVICWRSTKNRHETCACARIEQTTRYDMDSWFSYCNWDKCSDGQMFAGIGYAGAKLKPKKLLARAAQRERHHLV